MSFNLREEISSGLVDVNQVNDKGAPLFFQAVKNKDKALLNTILARDDLNITATYLSNDILSYSLLTNYLEGARLFLEDHRINVNYKIKSEALRLAAFKGYTDIVEKLIAAGASINARDSNGNTALLYASGHGHTKIVEDLIAAKANVNAQNNLGNTPLLLASDRGHSEVVEHLIANGADVNLQNNAGETPLVFSLTKGHFSITQKLLDAGAYEVKIISQIGNREIKHSITTQQESTLTSDDADAIAQTVTKTLEANSAGEQTAIEIANAIFDTEKLDNSVEPDVTEVNISTDPIAANELIFDNTENTQVEFSGDTAVETGADHS